MSALRLILILLGAVLGTSCQNGLVQRLTKAKPVPVSPFLDKRQEMRPVRNRLPVHQVWRNMDLDTQMEVMRRTELHIAPVDLRYLQPVSKDLAKWEMSQGWTRRDEAAMGRELRSRFAQAFFRSPQPRYRIVPAPGPKSLTLELAITQLNPTSVRGNVVKLASKFVIGPFSGLLGVFTKGNIAIEGKVSISDTGAPVMQFSDNEKDKVTLYTARDFQPYAHALMAMTEWAAQFEEFTRTYSHHKVDESSFFTLRPW
jgi:hypothetical protein